MLCSGALHALVLKQKSCVQGVCEQIVNGVGGLRGTRSREGAHRPVPGRAPLFLQPAVLVLVHHIVWSSMCASSKEVRHVPCGWRKHLSP